MSTIHEHDNELVSSLVRNSNEHMLSPKNGNQFIEPEDRLNSTVSEQKAGYSEFNSNIESSPSLEIAASPYFANMP